MSESNEKTIYPTGCFAEGQGILMANGRIKEVQDIVEGDLVMCNDQQYVGVTAVYKGHGETYCITPKRGKPYYISTQTILALTHKSTGSHKRISADVFFDKQRTPDQKDWRLYKGHVWKFKAVAMPNEKTAYEIGSALDEKTYTDLKEVDIPAYQFSNIENRLWFLAGLMDHNAIKTLTGYGIHTRSKELADLILFLSWSVGIRGYMEASTGVYKITLIEQGGGVHIPSKKYSFGQGELMESMLKRIPSDHDPHTFKMQKAGERDYYGIVLEDPDQIYMTDEFTCVSPCKFATKVIRQ